MNELELRDIHFPDDSLWWPPAPGWWVLALLLILAIYTWPRLRKWLRRKSIKTLCLKEFKRIRRAASEQQDVVQTLGQVSTLLRRTLISYNGRTTSASLTGEAWLEQLDALTGQRCFDSEQGELLARGQYQREIELDPEALLDSCERWIKLLPGGKRHAPD